MNALKNHFLVSVPHMNDTLFGKSVVYICDHNKEGAMGLIINKSIDHRELKGIIKIQDLHSNQLENIKITIHFGGPVLIEKMIVLHTNTLKTKNAVVITNEISISSEKDIIKNISKNINMKYKLFLGHAGWGAGQLEREIENGDWLLQSFNNELLFDIPSEKIWEQAIKSLGIDINDISNIGGMA